MRLLDTGYPRKGGRYYRTYERPGKKTFVVRTAEAGRRCFRFVAPRRLPRG
jgi:hypothetical protein